jgi:hypothetical protein
MIHKITQAAKSQYPAALFDAATAVRIAAEFDLSFRETRELEQLLHILVRKASLRIEAAFPVDDALEHVPELSIHAGEEPNGDADANPTDSYFGKRFIIDRAHFDVHRHGCTYMKIPSVLPWDTEGQAAAAPVKNNTLVAGISVAPVTNGWLHALGEHYKTSG